MFTRKWYSNFTGYDEELTEKLKDKTVLGITGEIYHEGPTGLYTDRILLALRLKKASIL